jgi:hypothetical protein
MSKEAYLRVVEFILAHALDGDLAFCQLVVGLVNVGKGATKEATRSDQMTSRLSKGRHSLSHLFYEFDRGR